MEFNHLFIVTHTDLDGIGSAAATLRLLSRSESDSTILFAEPYNIGDVLSDIKDSVDRGDLLIIADLGVNKNAFEKALGIIKDLARRGSIIEWYDHHVWSPEEINSLEKIGVKVVIDRSTCATGVVARYLKGLEAFESDKLLIELESVVCSADLWKWDHPLSPKLFRVVGERREGEEWKRKLAYKMAKGVLWDEEMEAKLEEYVNLELKGFSRVLNNAYTSNSNGAIIAVTYKNFSGPPSSSMIGALLLSRFNADIAAIVRSDGGLSLRSKNFNVQALAKALGGGGHPKAAGAKIRIPIYIKLLSLIYPKITSYYTFKIVSSTLKSITINNFMQQ